MKVVTAIDSFKGSLTSIQAGQATQIGIQRVDPTIQVVVRPLADGGEGTVDALTSGMQGQLVTVEVNGPLGDPLECSYGIIPDSMTAVIEMSAAAGITLLPQEKRNPLYTTTFGVGQMIRHAIGQGCRHFIIGIGGSATNDGGVGMLQALGFDFLDQKGDKIPNGALGLHFLTGIGVDHVMSELAECTFRVACDVTNPLCGPEGCSAIYGPQKGATPEMVQDMDQWLRHYADLAGESLPQRAKSAESRDQRALRKCKPSPSLADTPGAGAAGGMGFAFLAFLNASLESGIDIVLDETDLESEIKDADLVITGEGMLDRQTSMGKAPIGVARIARKYQKPVIAFAGAVTPDARACNAAGIDAFFPILRGVTSLADAMETETAMQNLSDTAEQVMRLWMLGHIMSVH